MKLKKKIVVGFNRLPIIQGYATVLSANQSWHISTFLELVRDEFPVVHDKYKRMMFSLSLPEIYLCCP